MGARRYLGTFIAAAVFALAATAPAQTASQPKAELDALRQEIARLQAELAQTRDLLEEARREMQTTRQAIGADEQVKTRFEIWRKERDAAEAQRAAYNRERARLEQAQQSLTRTVRAEDLRVAQHQQRLEDLRQPPTAEPPRDVTFYDRSYYPYTGLGFYSYPYFGYSPYGYFRIGPTRSIYRGPYRYNPSTGRSESPGDRPARRVSLADDQTPFPLRVPSSVRSGSGGFRVSGSDRRATATPSVNPGVIVDSNSSTVTPTLPQLRAQLEHIRTRYPSQARPTDPNAYRVSGNARPRTPAEAADNRDVRLYRSPDGRTPGKDSGVLSLPRRTDTAAPSEPRVMDRAQQRHFETRYPSESRGDNSRYRVSDR